ncbi:MAG: ROK family protein [Anaerolineales bacterium]|nr:ROK family protein [Anaerolineales bacterium]
MSILITPEISLNRVVIADLPGVKLPEGIRGHNAYQLVSVMALAAMIRPQLEALQLDPNLNENALIRAFDDCLVSTAETVRSTAEKIAQDFGRRFGFILLALQRGDAVNRQARPEWDVTNWEHWAGIRHVWLGGGLVSGNLGARMATYAQAVLHENEIVDYTVKVAPYTASLPMAGAARYLPADAGRGLVFDFGGTSIKRGFVELAGGILTNIQRLESVQTPWSHLTSEDTDSVENAQALIDGMVAVIVDTYRNLTGKGGDIADTIPVSLAAYVQDGRPLAKQGGAYTRANQVTDNLERELGQHLSKTLGHDIGVKLLHDGSAAAAVYAGERRTAVIMIGTALGIGFPDAGGGLRQLAADFEVR